jgi:hypothetical protein
MGFGKLAAAATLTLTLALSVAGAANASVIYNNGGPDNIGGNETVAWLQAEDFNFGVATTVTGAGVYLAGFGGIGSWDGSFQYYIFANDGGQPSAVLDSGSVTPSVTDTGSAWCCDGNAYLFEFDFGSDFLAQAGVTYFLGIHAGAPDNFNRDEIYWVTTADNSTLRGIESSGGTLDNWFSNGSEHAFFLNGERQGGVVPEPSTWALMISGFGAAGAMLRRRKAALA